MIKKSLFQNKKTVWLLIFFALVFSKLTPYLLKTELKLQVQQSFFTNLAVFDLRETLVFYLNYYSFTNLFFQNKLIFQINFIDLILIPLGIIQILNFKNTYKLSFIFLTIIMPWLKLSGNNVLSLNNLISILYFSFLSYLGFLTFYNILSKYRIVIQIIAISFFLFAYLYFYFINIDGYLLHNLAK